MEHNRRNEIIINTFKIAGAAIIETAARAIAPKKNFTVFIIKY